jgi:hypothetical protein
VGASRPSGNGPGNADDVTGVFPNSCATGTDRTLSGGGREAAARRARSQSPQTPPRATPSKATQTTLVSLGVAAARAATFNPKPPKGFSLPASAGERVAAVLGVTSASKCSLNGWVGSAVSLVEGPCLWLSVARARAYITGR